MYNKQSSYENKLDGADSTIGIVKLEGAENYSLTDVYPIDGKLYLYFPEDTVNTSVTAADGTINII